MIRPAYMCLKRLIVVTLSAKEFKVRGENISIPPQMRIGSERNALSI